ncbi:unnamed protein product [Schistosoma turkestanicum]|nr:unnamed protein product [Schistosoma turkestanicum]
MNIIHSSGIRFINWIQNCEQLEPLFTAVSHFGSPNTAYLLTFPTAYYIDPTLGIMTILCAATADWLNGILKWILYGHRPYWWVTLIHPLVDADSLSIRQYPLTCEVGPGSPSGHCMVTVASLTPMICYFYHKLKNRNHQRYLVTLCCLLFGLIALSRCYLAAHFPHQVILGIISGAIVGLLFTSVGSFTSSQNDDNMNWLHRQSVYLLIHPIRLIWLGFSSFLFAYMFSVFLEYGLKLDPNWSITLAKSACLRPEWIHLSTSLMMGFSRIAAGATSLSLSLLLNKPTHSKQLVLGTNSISIILFSLIIVLISTKLMESICNQLIDLFPIQNNNESMMNLLSLFHHSFLQNTTICPFMTVFIVPTCMNWFLHKYNKLNNKI